MRLATLRRGSGVGVGVVVGEDEIADLAGVGRVFATDAGTLVAGGADALEAARDRCGWAPRIPLGQARLGPPVLRPPKFLAIARNYAAHAAEQGAAPPAHQTWFNKQSTCVVGPDDPVVAPPESEKLDYEGELGVVIGRRCRRVTAAGALDVIGGYTVVNDVTARDWQSRAPTMTLGKSFDTHGPTGPFLVTPEEVGDPQSLSVRTWVNDELRQDGNTADMIFGCAAMIELLSTVFTLEPGDILSTGTPAGVGAAMDPPRFLRPGDVVRVEVERVGTLRNPVVAEGPGHGSVLQGAQ